MRILPEEVGETKLEGSMVKVNRGGGTLCGEPRTRRKNAPKRTVIGSRRRINSGRQACKLSIKGKRAATFGDLRNSTRTRSPDSCSRRQNIKKKRTNEGVRTGATTSK